MKITKEELTFMVCDTPYEEWGLEKEEAAPISIMVQEDGGMYDQHIIHLFPGLHIKGLVEVMEGHMEYYGDLTKEELITTLTNSGFNAYIGSSF